MSKRILRTVPAAVLMTTALAWGMPAAAQSGTMGTPPATMSPGAATKAPPKAIGESSTGSAAGGAAFGGGNTLPADLTPAMPASAASAPADGVIRGSSGLPPKTSRP